VAVLVVDSSVWIDFFRNLANDATAALEQLLSDGEVRIVVPDLVLFEVMRGFRYEDEYSDALALLQGLHIEPACTPEIALRAAQHYRSLREQGVTVASSIDVLLATFCIERGYTLLHRDRDYAAFEDARGLRGWPH
jgi:predicted nucleic acid-binding protein